MKSASTVTVCEPDLTTIGTRKAPVRSATFGKSSRVGFRNVKPLPPSDLARSYLRQVKSFGCRKRTNRAFACFAFGKTSTSESIWMPPLPFEKSASAWPVSVRSPSFGRCTGHVGALNEVGFRAPPVQPEPRSSRVTSVAAAFVWSPLRSFVRGSHGSRAPAAAASTPASTLAATRLRHIRAGLLDELLGDRLLERDELPCEHRGRDDIQRVLEPTLADEDEVTHERDLVAPGAQHHRAAIGRARRSEARKRELAHHDRDDLALAGLLQLVGEAVLE